MCLCSSVILAYNLFFAISLTVLLSDDADFVYKFRIIPCISIFWNSERSIGIICSFAQ